MIHNVVHSALFRKLLLSISLASIGFLTMLTVVIHYTNEQLEYDLLDKQISTEISNVRQRLELDPDSPLPRTANLSVYLQSRAARAFFPEYLRDYAPGSHHDIEFNERAYHIRVERFDSDLIYLQYDITDIEQSEERLQLIMLSAWLLMMLLIVLLAYALSRYLARPIARLSEEVSQLVPDLRGVQLGQNYADDEVGKIARAFDLYLSRMDDYVEKQSTFAAMASHELRSPMTIIQTSADLVDLTHHDDLTRQQIDKIQRATRHMRDLVEALLQVTRDERSHATEKVINMKQLIDEILASLNADYSMKNIAIHNRLGEETQINADPVLANVVCTNLIKNAIKHGGDSDIAIEMENNELAIIDSGFGIDTRDLEHIFDFAYRGQASQGYGIGLYISKLICDHQRWSLGLCPAENGGTRASVDFSATLPLTSD
jgi:signal transduction histidine kinase